MLTHAPRLTRVHVLHPHGVHRPVEHHPLQVGAVLPARHHPADDAGRQAVLPLVGGGVVGAVQLAQRDGLGVDHVGVHGLVGAVGGGVEGVGQGQGGEGGQGGGGGDGAQAGVFEPGVGGGGGGEGAAVGAASVGGGLAVQAGDSGGEGAVDAGLAATGGTNLRVGVGELVALDGQACNPASGTVNTYQGQVAVMMEGCV